jgi:ubiquinone/menaquinone biosynthesis C-methylase UbiE
MAEINLMERYPKSKRSVADRGPAITEEVRAISRQFGRDYFDGDRRYGYGGYSYHPRFWQDTVTLFHDHYGLADDASALDIGCGKGFMLHDFKRLYPAMTVAGIDISEYAIANAIEAMKPFVQVASARELPFPDRSFDLVTAINTIHNLPLEECKQSLREIQRVSRGHSFIMVDAWSNDEEKARMQDWVITARSMMHVDDWKKLFDEVGYTGDYYWFIA